MGSCYSVVLGVKFKSKAKAIKELQDFIASGVSKLNRVTADFSLDNHKSEGVGTETWDDLARIFLAHWKGQEVQMGEWRKNPKTKRNQLYRKDRNGFLIHQNGFNASYGWEMVMMEMFALIAPHLKDGSWMDIDCDDGVDELVVENGKYKQVR